MKNVYLVSYKNTATNKPLMQLFSNKKYAIKLAKANEGKIRFMSYGLYNCYSPGDYGWDYPTFYAQSDELVF
jgi:hypothetical protein